MNMSARLCRLQYLFLSRRLEIGCFLLLLAYRRERKYHFIADRALWVDTSAARPSSLMRSTQLSGDGPMPRASRVMLFTSRHFRLFAAPAYVRF